MDQIVNVTVSINRAVEGGFQSRSATRSEPRESSDYTVNTTSPLTFAGLFAESRTISVTIKGDDVVEDNETFRSRSGM